MADIQVAIVEDDRSIRESLTAFLSSIPGLSVVLVSESMEAFLEAIRQAARPEPDVLLLDIGLPGMSGLVGIPAIKKELSDTNIVMLTSFEEEEKIFKALCAGAVAYLSKRTSLPQIQEAIFTIYRGGSYMSPSIARKVVNHFAPKKKATTQLTARQQEIVEGIMEGLSYKLIADKLMISVDTVRDHIKKIYRALNVNSKTELMRRAIDGEIEGIG